MTTQTFSGDSQVWQHGLSLLRLLVALLAGSSILLPNASDAEEQQTVQRYLLEARRLYDNFDDERALEQLSQARRLSGGPQDDALLSLYEGAVLADLGRTEASDAAFKAALLLQPEATLPVQVSPKVEQRFEAVRQHVKRELEAEAKRLAALESPRATAEAPVAQVQPLTTGEAVSHVPPPAASADAAPAEVRPLQVPPAPSAGAAVPMPVTPPASAPHAQVPQVSNGRGARSRAWLPATIGGGLMVGGGVSYLLARGEQSKLRSHDAGLATLEDVKRSASRGRMYQSVGLSLAGAGVVSLGISAGMYLLGRPSQSQTLGLDMGTDGTSAFVQGRWP